MVNAQGVFLEGNGHFLQDRPHGPVFFFENPPIMHFQIRKRWYKKFPPGPPEVPPAPAACPPVYPPHKPGTHHTHSLTQSYIHTERHHKNPKDISFGKNRTLDLKNANFEWIILNKLFKTAKIVTRFQLKFCDLSGAKDCKSCRSRKSSKMSIWLLS